MNSRAIACAGASVGIVLALVYAMVLNEQASRTAPTQVDVQLAPVVSAGSQFELQRFYDRQYGVVCYRVKHSEGLSCLPFRALRDSVR